MKGLRDVLLCVACVALAEGAVAASEYIVKQGDTLWGIARKHKISYEQLCALNGKPCDWSLIKVGQKIVVAPELPRISGVQLASLGSPCAAVPKKAKLLNEYGDLALFSGETDADAAFNADPERKDDWLARNSLFLRRRTSNGKSEWRLLLATGSDWRDAAGMHEWYADRARDVKNCFYVFKASFSSDGRHLWLVCNPHTFTYSVVCSYDVHNHTFRVLIDGDTADEQSDGTILAKNKKTYLFDDNGEPLGARFYDAWINADGEIIRKGKLKTAEGVD